MKKYIFFFIFIANTTFASSSIDCENPKNILECSKITFSKVEKSYLSLVQSAEIKLKEKTNSMYAERFLKIEEMWRKMVRKQCQHLRDFYQGGTIGTTNFVACYDVMYEHREKELRSIYDDILGER